MSWKGPAPPIRSCWRQSRSTELGGLEARWGWYRQGSVEGAFLHKAGPDGVHSTKITYYAPAPQNVPGASGTETSA